ncbi:hypothetical protein FQV37_2598 [Psychrobacter nivimaris]|uniref:Uncharacterized protein n=1 Tax=Psychrobacter nivimaris TaxID=281738 RepID=A0A6N7C2K7_9GAMM|nr:hypothetical protein [Psychrobacter nivimaris]KAF0569572.1 hypothetical protein FQV37_2598 [Psychrobacter nivimaris]
MSDKLFVIKKPGVYWRPDSCGYTNNRIEAGFYTEDEAKEVCDDPRSGCTYKPVAELFESKAEIDAIIANLETIKEQMRLHASEVAK